MRASFFYSEVNIITTLCPHSQQMHKLAIQIEIFITFIVRLFHTIFKTRHRVSTQHSQ